MISIWLLNPYALNRPNLPRRIFALFILAVMPLSSSIAQPNRGTASTATQSLQELLDLHVAVVDVQGAKLVTARLVLRSDESRLKLEQIPDSDGRTTFLSLPPGTYSLTVSAQCFQTKEEKVRIDRQPVMVTVSMHVGGECLRPDKIYSVVPVPVDETTHNPEIIPYPIQPLPKEKKKKQH